MLFIALSATLVVVFDLITIYTAKKQINEYKYKIFSSLMSTSIVTLVLVTICFGVNLISYLILLKKASLINAYLYLVIAIQFSFHILSSNYICDAGIWSWGRLYKWGKISSYYWSDDGQYVLFEFSRKFLVHENKLKFRIKDELRDEISFFLDNHI
jgi:hypothetical protein